jgi:hypothetical protein
MSIGMKVMCSIQSGTLRNLKESHVKALWGNQLILPVFYKVRQYSLSMSTQYNNDQSWYDGMPYGSPAIVWKTLYNYTMANSGTFNDISQIAALLASGFTWSSSESSTSTIDASTYHGWTWYSCYPGGGGTPGKVGYVQLSLSKNTSGITQPYFIARHRGYAFYDVTPNFAAPNGFVIPGVLCIQNIWEIVSTGFVDANKVIGYGADINLPFPSEPPSALTVNGNCVQTTDAYYAVIGQSPDTWAASIVDASTGFPAPVTFGTQTALTGGTFDPAAGIQFNEGFGFNESSRF